MIRAVARGLLLVMIAMAVRADTLDDAVAALAKKVVARLEPFERVRIGERNISSLPATEVSRAEVALTRALQSRGSGSMPVDVVVTISDDLRGYILVAEIRRASGTVVEMMEFRLAPPAAPARAAIIDSKLLWEQDTAILDVAVLQDSMLVLDTAGLIRYERHEGKWERAAAVELPVVVRDPRGRAETNGESVTINEPGVICTVPVKMEVPPRCDDGGQFKAARNTQDLHDWRGEFFSSSELAGDIIVAEVDGRIHIYDAAHALQAVFDGWGSDLAVIAACGGRHIAIAGSSDAASPDSIALYDLVNHALMSVSEPIDLSGPVTALWPAGDGAMAVTRNLSTGKYAAYSLTLDCSR
ncbi:MAG TPA: hypothetical protein VGQ49_23235 [Bryobacteraceae bacterium]|jgi:hypothetical protein|nr:hypothetical protein [Bryobacteraceae bacterium]